MDRLLAGPDGAAGAPAGGGSGRSGGVLSLRGWSLEMLQVGGQPRASLTLVGPCLPPQTAPPSLLPRCRPQAACVLAGCDFAPSIKGISFRTAAGFVARRRSLAGALKAIRLERRFQLSATEQYCAAAERAALAFKHALGEHAAQQALTMAHSGSRMALGALAALANSDALVLCSTRAVFCANTAGGSCRRLTPVPERGGAGGAGQAGALDLSHLGAELDAETARGIALGTWLAPPPRCPLAPGPVFSAPPALDAPAFAACREPAPAHPAAFPGGQRGSTGDGR